MVQIAKITVLFMAIVGTCALPTKMTPLPTPHEEHVGGTPAELAQEANVGASNVSSVELHAVLKNPSDPTPGAQCWWLNGANPPTPCWTPSCRAPAGDVCDTPPCGNNVWVKAQNGPSGMDDCKNYNNGPNQCTSTQNDDQDQACPQLPHAVVRAHLSIESDSETRIDGGHGNPI